VRVCVTGAAGLTGSVTVNHLLAHGYEVVGTDVGPHPSSVPAVWSRPDFTYTRADLTDYGDTIDVLAGADAVVHLANIPAPGLFTAARTLNANLAMNTNVFLAAASLHLSRVVWASSETTLGLDFEVPPRYAPLDEDHYPHPTTAYSLSKVMSETAAQHVSAWSGIPFVALRLSNVIGPGRYATFPEAWQDPARRKFNLWSYVDVRDCAMACGRALEAEVSGARSYIIAAADSAMPVPSAELMRRYFPAVPLTRTLGEFETLECIDRARAEIGYEPRHTWRREIEAGDGS
jgi:nucleoside-diphosphate-sugar epimerase